MIRCLILNNFQAHQFSELELSEGVNIITGTSNSGKTSIVRALAWVMNNRPRGDGIIRKGTEESFVAVVLDNAGVTRRRNKKFNGYEVDCKSQEHTVKLEALGGDVPKEVSEVLNLTDINMQEQFSPYFLVMDSPGKVGQYINSITKLSELDQVISSIGSKIRATSSKKSSLTDELDQIDIEFAEVNKYNLDLIELKLKEHTEYIAECVKLDSGKESLHVLITQLTEVEDKLAQIIPDITKPLADATILATEYQHKETCIESIAVDIAQYKEIAEALEQMPPDVSESLEEASQLAVKYNSLEEDVQELQSYIIAYKLYEKELVELQDSLSLLEINEKEILTSLTVCPSCGQDMDDKVKSYYLERVL